MKLETSGCWIGTQTWGWCHHHTSVTLLWSQLMAPGTSEAAYTCTAAESMDSWTVTKRPVLWCGSDTSSCLDPYPMATCPMFHICFRLGRKLSPCPYDAADAHGSMGCNPKSFTTTVVWQWHQPLSSSLPNGHLSWVSCRIGWEIFTLPSYMNVIDNR